MEDRLKIFKRIIRECSYDNTYKMAMAKALVELSEKYVDSEANEIELDMEVIAQYYLKYYWNQTIFFDLVQGSNLKKIPVILQSTKDLISAYYDSKGDRQPVRFERVEEYLEKNCSKELKKTIATIARKLPDDVAWRFIRIDGVVFEEVYRFDDDRKKIVISRTMLALLYENRDDLFDLIDYRWGLILETFNSSPRINRKVKIIDGQDIKRTDLKKYRKYLDAENPRRKCFICGKEIPDDELSIDHVIPWSYLYSDDLWNLVYVHRSCNSSKTNRIPVEKTIFSLEERNERLLKILKLSGLSGKAVDELEVAIEKDYVNKFWIGCK